MGKVSLRDKKMSFPAFKKAFGKHFTRDEFGRMLDEKGAEKAMIANWEQETGKKYKKSDISRNSGQDQTD